MFALRRSSLGYFPSQQVGDKITLADITVASALVYPMKLVMSPEYRKAFPCVTRWFTTCVNQPQFMAVVGTVELAKEEMTAEGAPAVPKKEVRLSCHKADPVRANGIYLDLHRPKGKRGNQKKLQGSLVERRQHMSTC